MAETNVKYLSYTGLKTYNSQLKKYYSNANVEGIVGISDKAIKLKTERTVELIGAVTGDFNFDGSKNVTVSTTLTPLSGEHNISVTGNAGTATNFENAKTIDLTGHVTGHAAGGNTPDGWSISTTIPASTITNSMLAGSIGVDKLASNTITIGSTSIKLGESASSITADVVGNLTGNASTATKATQDASGNVIVTTYATKAELEQVKSAIRFKGSVETFADLPANPENGDIYNVVNDPDTSKNKSWIWSSQDNAWSIFGSSYGPATSDTFGLVKIGSNITNSSGTISLTQSNIDGALGYEPMLGVKVNGTRVYAVDRIVDIDVPTDYATQEDIDASFTFSNITTGLGYTPIENVAVSGTDLPIVNRRVNVDLTGHATKDWTTEQINQKLTSLYVFKGTVQTYGDLLNIEEKSVGHTYNVIEGNDPETQEPTWPSFAAGTNFAWDGDEWDALGGTLDLSNYYKKTETDALLATKAALSHSHNDLYYTKSEVDALITNLKTWVNNRIVEYFEAAQDEGIVNDIRTYATYAAFPAKGVSDVQYIAADTQIEYQWKWTSEELQTGEYVQINAVTTSEDIEDLFK